MANLDPQFDALAEKIAARVISKIYTNRPPVAPEWLNFDQAAAYLGYTTTKAFRDRCSKPNPPSSSKVGRLRRFKRDGLDTWVRGDGA